MGHDLADIQGRSFKFLFSHFHPYPLYVFQWCVERGFFESAYKISSADRESFGQFVHAYLIFKIFLDKDLSLFYRIIFMILLPTEYYELILVTAIKIDLRDFGTPDGSISAVMFFNYIQDCLLSIFL